MNVHKMIRTIRKKIKKRGALKRPFKCRALKHKRNKVALKRKK